MTIEVDKLEIADEILEASIDEFLDKGRFYSALNLAGVAAELYGKYVRITGGIDSQKEVIGIALELIESWSAPEVTLRDMKKIANHPKNGVKHFDSESDRYIELNAEDEAMYLIAEAIANHEKLNRGATLAIQRFYEFGQQKAIEMQAESEHL